jgi:hypothetical protein
MDAFLWRPVIRGYWRQHETADGTYSIHDLIEVNRVLDMIDENDRRRIESTSTR